MKAAFIMDLKALYEKYGISRPYEQDAKIMLDSLINRKVFPEVVETISKLREAYRVVIGSTTDTAPLLKNMQENKLCVDKIYTSEMIRKYKPAKAFYQYILEQENCQAEEAVFIGDSLNDDVFGPQSGGIITVLVDRKNKYGLTETVRADYVVKSMDEILELNFYVSKK